MDQVKHFEIGHLHLKLPLDRSFKSKHTLQNATNKPRYWVSDICRHNYKAQKLKHDLKKCHFSNQLVKMKTTSFNARGAVSERRLANPLKIPTAFCGYCQTQSIFSPVVPLWFSWKLHRQQVLTWLQGKKCRDIKSEEHVGQKVGPTRPIATASKCSLMVP